jgi:hypothetical protein
MGKHKGGKRGKGKVWQALPPGLPPGYFRPQALLQAALDGDVDMIREHLSRPTQALLQAALHGNVDLVREVLSRRVMTASST